MLSKTSVIEKENQISYTSLVMCSSNISFPTITFELQAFGSSSIFLLAFILAAYLDPNDLQLKMILQSSGIGHFLDTYSDAVIVLILMYLLITKDKWRNMQKPLKMRYIGSILFGVVATYFHAAANEAEPHPLFSCYFTAVGAFILFWHARGFASKCTSPQKNLIAEVEVKFICLGIVPTLVCLLGASSVISKFVFNGWAFLYNAIMLDPLLKESMRDAASSLQIKLSMIRFILPLISCSFLAESLVAESWNVDVHCIIHVLAASHVLLAHSCMA